ncbi:MAG: AAA family ATPase [Candidatus Lokiarchaeota archaeon]|nr:AAA family ATPase [Candidatus Lokiarchaeota archaeon]
MNPKNNLFPKLVLLSGTPGTGKTSISNILKGIDNWYIFPLGEFIIEKNLYIEKDDARNTKIIDSDVVGLHAFAEIVKIIFNSRKLSLNTNYNALDNIDVIIVDSHYADILIDGIARFKENYEKNMKNFDLNVDLKDIKHLIRKFKDNESIIAIILRCEPYKLQKRLRKREYNEYKVLENIQAEILGESTQNMIEVLNAKHIFEINTTTLSKKEIAEKCKMIICESDKIQNHYKVGKIDWLAEMGKNGTYEKFFNTDVGNMEELEFFEGNVIHKRNDNK